ncbi:uncharacterized protein VTP21DRAFT_8869 [Calcarisporiella thermophila]|uniref:uncharacterized protein n=1 Tax=Calcarisporiella thermophila TaxID=911321 RepID=UPI0037424717
MSVSLAETFRQYREREEHWFSSLTTEQHCALTANGSLTINDRFLYGEICFLLCGLKPCVLIDFGSASADYITRVAIPLLQPLAREEDERFNRVKHIFFNSESDGRVTDAEVGEILDYPGHLPESEEDSICEIAYFDITDGNVPRLVTAFIALGRELSKVQQHFNHYRSTVNYQLGMKLKLSIRSPYFQE